MKLSTRFTARSTTVLLLTLIVLLASQAFAIDLGTEPVGSTELRQDMQKSIRSTTSQPGIAGVEIAEDVPSASPRRDDGQGQLLWGVNDEVSISEHVAISADGAWVAIGQTLNNDRLEVRDGSSGELEFSYPVNGGGGWVAISANGRIIAYSAMDSVWLFTRDLGDRPYMRFGMGGYAAGPVALSADGSRLIATGVDTLGRSNRVWGFDIVQGVGDPLWEHDVDANEAYYWYGANITPDGAVTVVNGKFRLYVLNAENGDLIWDAPTYNTESPTAISDDASILVTASLAGRLRVFTPSGDGYSELWHYNFTGGVASWVSACAVSGDGLTVAAGTLDFLQRGVQGRVAIFDTFGGGRPNWIADPLGDEISGISISRDGGVIAVSTWGDTDNQTPDLVVHERHNRQPFYRLSTQGSFNSVSITRDGTKVVASGKGVHNRVFGSGGIVDAVDLALQGAIVNGIVREQGGGAIEGVQVTATDNPYVAKSDRQGRYSLRIQTNDVRQIAISARNPGYNFATQNVEVAPGRNVNDINFSLTAAGASPQNVRASQGARNQITVTWTPYNGRRLPRRAVSALNGVHSAQGSPSPDLTITGYDEAQSIPRRDDADDADSIRIFRSFLPGGPFFWLGSVSGDAERFIDTDGVIPGRRYYYTTTALFGNGESDYSNVAAGWVDDQFLIWDADLSAMPNSPNLDGVIDDEEWQGAVVRDISDVLGYDNLDSAGTVIARIGFNDANDQLYIGVSFYGLRSLQDRSGIGVYVDDDGDGEWSLNKPGAEGNYWGYFQNGGPDMRYRSLTGNPYAISPYYNFEDPPLAFGIQRGYEEIEMAIPLGFHGPEEVTLKSPEKIIGLGLFALQRDQGGNNVFSGWWPQDMFSIVSNPEQFARVHIPATLVVPPGVPNELFLERDGDALLLRWADPDTAVDGSHLENWTGVRVYRNGSFLTSVNRGVQEYTDEDILPGGWYEYSVSGYVIDDNEPFEGPVSRTIGMYALSDPQVQSFSYNDGTSEQFYVVDFSGEDNRFAVRFDIPASNRDTIGVFWIDLYHQGVAPVDLYIMTAGDFAPDQPTGYRLSTVTDATTGFQRFHFPAATQPRVVVDPDLGGSFWVIMNYRAESPASPYLGVDESSNDESRNMYYKAGAGWSPFPLGQLMMRVAVGIPPAETPGENEPILPSMFVVHPNFPNPFNGSTSIPLTLPGTTAIKLSLFDLNGRAVWVGNSGVFGPGYHTIPVSLNALPSGVYRLEVKSDFGVGGNELHLLR